MTREAITLNPMVICKALLLMVGPNVPNYLCNNLLPLLRHKETSCPSSNKFPQLQLIIFHVHPQKLVEDICWVSLDNITLIDVWDFNPNDKDLPNVNTTLVASCFLFIFILDYIP